MFARTANAREIPSARSERPAAQSHSMAASRSALSTARFRPRSRVRPPASKLSAHLGRKVPCAPRRITVRSAAKPRTPCPTRSPKGRTAFPPPRSLPHKIRGRISGREAPCYFSRFRFLAIGKMFLVKGQPLFHSRAAFRGRVREAQRLLLEFHGLCEIARLGISRRECVDGSSVLPLRFSASIFRESYGLFSVAHRPLGASGIEPGDMIQE